MDIRAPARAVLVGVWWCVAHGVVMSVEGPVLTFVGFPRTRLLDMVTAVALSIFGGTSHHLWLTALAVTADLHSTCQLGLPGHAQCICCTADDRFQERRISTWARSWLWLQVRSSPALAAVAATGTRCLHRPATCDHLSP